MANPHFDIASYTLERVVKPLDAVSAMAHTQIAQAHATLAIAHELRTANLIALSTVCETAQISDCGAFAEATTRLNLGDPK